jgi:hypothetical protein
MALRFSTGLRNAMLGDSAPTISIIAEDTIALVDSGTTAADTITNSGGTSFVTAGFVVGDTVTVSGATDTDDDGTYVVSAVTATTLTIPTASFTTGQTAGTVVAVAAARGGSMKDQLRNGTLSIYSGTQPANADTAYAGTLLCTYTISSGAFSAGSETNGLEFGDAASGAIDKASGEVWSGEAAATGTAGWFRFSGNATDAHGASTTLPRIDGTCGTSGSDLVLSTTSFVSGQTYTIDQFEITLPYQYGA